MHLDAAKLVGLLAEPDRLRVVAALVLEPDTVDGAAARAGLDRRSATGALERLAAAGLVRRSDDGTLSVDDAAFKSAARGAAPPAVGATATGNEERLLARAVVDGRITRIPARQSKKVVLLDWLVQRFEPGRRYREREVNDLLLAAHDDYAALRRLLVDFGFLDRAEGEYWRAGGSVDTSHPTAG